ncbi:MAG TPA: GAF domain-containing SpoIIE family protein phosphatase [Ignavibacteriaceae bacterium]
MSNEEIINKYLKKDYDKSEIKKINKNGGLENLQPNNILQIKDFMLLQRVIKKINSILDTAELLNQIVQDVSKTLGFTRCAVLLFHEKETELEIAALTGWDDDNFYPGFRLCKNHGIVWKAVREQRIVYIPDVLNFPEEAPCAFTSRSHLDVPLFHHGKFIGILNAQNIKVNAFSRHDLRVLKILASHISIAIENSRLFEIEKKEKEIMLVELKQAKDIQSRMFPKKSPDINNFKVNGICEPCQEVGGDWFDYIELSNGKTGVVLADVAGKGLSAAFLMSSARTIFRLIAKEEVNPSAVLKRVNDYLIDDLPPTRFITMIYLIIDDKTGKISISNAGHLYPMRIFQNNLTQIKFDTGFPLGIQKYDYQDHEIFLEKGEKLFLYSDGVTEATNSEHEYFEDKMMLKSLKSSNSNLNSIFKDVKTFIGSSTQNDDITIVEIEAL